MQPQNRLRGVLESEELMQRLAEAEHERWAHWQQYVHDQCDLREDGALVIPSELVERWNAQIATPYAELSIEEKKSDQEQVRRYLPIIIDALTAK
jgi:predicted aminopeptidase